MPSRVEMRRRGRASRGWLIAGGTLIAAFAIRTGLDPILRDQAPYLFFAMATLLSARYGGLGPGVITALAGGVIGNLVFVSPKGGFDVSDGRYFIGLGAYLLLCGVAIAICESLRRARRSAEMLALHADANSEDLRREMDNRAKIEQLLRDSEKRYRFLAESIPQVVWTARPDGVTNYNNQWMFDYFGATRDQMQKSGWTAFRHPDDRAAATERWQHSIRTGEPYECTYRLLRGSDKTWRWHLARAVPMRDEHGQIILWFGTCVDIDDSKRAGDTVRASEEQFRAVFDLAGSGKALAEPATGRFVRVNRKLCEMTGYSSNELLGMSYLELTHPDDLAWCREEFNKLLHGETSFYAGEKRYIRKDGGVIWVNLAVTMIHDAQGRPVHAAGVIQDVTERRRADQALRDSEERFRLAARAVNGMVYDWDVRSGAVLRSEGLADLTGVDAASAPATRDWWYERIHPADRPHIDEIAGAISGGSEAGDHFSIEYRVRHEDGTWVDLWDRGYLIRDPDDKLVRVVGFTADITQRKRAELALREREAFFRTMGEAVPDFIWSADADGRIVYFNWRWEEYTGLTLQQFNEQGGWQRVHHPDELESLLHHLERTARGGEPAHFECRLLRRDGVYRWFMGRTAAVRDPAGAADGRIVRWVGTLTDIDDRKRIEAELRAANRAKDQFLATLSHELRTPLTPVVLTLGALLDDPALPAHVREDLRVIERNVVLETNLIDDLLDLTRIARGKLELRPRLVDVHAVLEHAVRSCCATDAHEKLLEVRVECGARDAHVRADPHRLDQIFFNLLRNAVKFTPPGGRIDLATYTPRDGWIAVRVSDTGIGIEPEALARIFDAFEQGDRSVTRQFGGLGLGLAVSKALLDLHRGTIRAESAGRDRGATFIVEIPLADAAIAHTPTTDDSPPASIRSTRLDSDGAASGRLKILLVEDHDQTAQIMARLLRATNHAVVSAADIGSAMRLAEANEFDLVVSDLGLPDGSGLELMSQLRERYGLRGIALTGFGMEEDVRDSKAAGFVEHLVKPVAFSDLEAAIARVTAANA